MTTTRADARRPTGRRAQNKADKRARILEAAQGLLHEVGFTAMTTAQVAQRAGVAAGTVFQYAATKPELLMMVTAHEWRDAVADVLAATPDAASVETSIAGLLEPLVRAARAEPGNAMAVGRELLFGADGPHRAEVVELVTGLEAAIAGLLRDAGSAGPRAEIAARLIVSGGVLELNRTRTGRAEEASVEQRLRALVDVAVRGAGVASDGTRAGDAASE